VAEICILILDDDAVSQRALKHVLDSEGWRVRIVPMASYALSEIATGAWNLVIVNVALTGLHGPVFQTLRDLAQGEADAPEATADAPAGEAVDGAKPKKIRVLFLVPMLARKDVVPLLEREGLPYTLKPYSLHEFLEKVSELLLEAQAIREPIRSMGDRSFGRKGDRRSRLGARRGAMFASREEYQMTEEEMAEYERQEEEDRKKREKELKDLKHLG
jgi:DNA-binding response OmpR family regulator